MNIRIRKTGSNVKVYAKSIGSWIEVFSSDVYGDFDITLDGRDIEDVWYRNIYDKTKNLDADIEFIETKEMTL